MRKTAPSQSPYGPPMRGWEQVVTMELAASLRREGEMVGIETVEKYATPELAYIVEIERARTKIVRSC